VTVANWAGNVTFRAAEVVEPTTLDELAGHVRSAGAARGRLSVLGTGHSFSTIADTDGVLIRTDALRSIGPLDESNRTVTIEGGVRFAELGAWLHERGWALHNLPSLPHITVAGAAATATHGSGSTNQNLAGSVVAIDLVEPDGSIRRIDRGDADFPALAVGVGAFGPVARLVLAVEPTYEVEQRVWTALPWSVAAEHLDLLLDGAYSVSLFTRWLDQVEQVWVKARVDAEVGVDPTELGARPATSALHPVGGDPGSCTDQLGVPGPWHERLPHFRSGFVPSSGAELQSEYFVERSDAPAAIDAVRGMARTLDPVLLVSEIRAVAADDLWLSTASGRDTLALHFTWRLDTGAVGAVLPELERRLSPFGVRSHWGKLSTLTPAVVRSGFPRFDDAEAVHRRIDPDGLFGGLPM
jgi:xylitol oxidase